MLILRGTRKILRYLPLTAGDGDTSDTALGDWYVNRIVIDRQPLVLCLRSRSLLAVLVPARNLTRLPDQFPAIVADRLRHLGADSALIDAEIDAIRTIRVGRTRDRSVLGTMVDFAKVLPYYLPMDGWGEVDLMTAEEKLAETPCRCGRSQTVIWPHADTLRLLDERW